MDRTEKIETKIIHTGRDPESFGGSVNPPVYHFSTVLYKSVDELVSRYDNITPDSRVMTYGTKGSPTSFSLEDAVAELEGGFRSISFPSGLAAVAGALFAFLKSGDHLLMTDSVYYPTREFCSSILKRFGVETTYYPPCIGSEIEELIQENTTVIYTESPGSHTFEVQDIPALSAAAHRHQAKLIMDNTWASPIFFNPFIHGADVSIQAATKYINGHSDTLGGAVCTNDSEWHQKMVFSQKALGLQPSPFDCWLITRGIKTLPLRLKQQMTNAAALADQLASHPKVNWVRYPHRTDHPQHAVALRQMAAGGGIVTVSFNANQEETYALCKGLRWFTMAESLGGIESLICHPATMTHAAVSADMKAKLGIDDGLVRLSVGCEDLEDLQSDLQQALRLLA